MNLIVGVSTAYSLWNAWPTSHSPCAPGWPWPASPSPDPHPGQAGWSAAREWAFVGLHYLATPKLSVWRPREPDPADWQLGQGPGRRWTPACRNRRRCRRDSGGAMSKRASVQTARLSLEAIEDEVVLLARGQYRAVLEVSGVHGLQGDTEQEAIVGGFAAFLNSLSFATQVLVRVLPIDIDGYIGELERRAATSCPRTWRRSLAITSPSSADSRTGRSSSATSTSSCLPTPSRRVARHLVDGSSARRPRWRRSSQAARHPLRGGRAPAGSLRPLGPAPRQQRARAALLRLLVSRAVAGPAAPT